MQACGKLSTGRCTRAVKSAMAVDCIGRLGTGPPRSAASFGRPASQHIRCQGIAARWTGPSCAPTDVVRQASGAFIV